MLKPQDQPEPALTLADEAAILDGASRTMTRLVQAEIALKTTGKGDIEILQDLADMRRDLASGIRRATQVRNERRNLPTVRRPAAKSPEDSEP